MRVEGTHHLKAERLLISWEAEKFQNLNREGLLEVL